jgi:phosphoribosylformylglycinamidine synthase
MNVADSRDIFAESMSRAIIEVAPENCAAFEAMAGGLACQKIGTVGGDTFALNDVSMNLAQMQDVYYNTFKKVIEGDL